MNYEQFFDDNVCNNETCGAALTTPLSSCRFCGAIRELPKESKLISYNLHFL